MGVRAVRLFIPVLLAVALALVCGKAHAYVIASERLDPNHWVPADLLQQAVEYFNDNQDQFDNQKYMAVIDFRPRSDKYRFFVIHLLDGQVDRYHTAHGSGSVGHDKGYAVRFGNTPGSNRTSLGFARTAEVYVGSQNRSLKLDGLSSTNSNLRDRGIIIHGADQVREANVIQGLGGGCPMLDQKVHNLVIDELRDGGLVYFGYSQRP